jgi:hypothetical protein
MENSVTKTVDGGFYGTIERCDHWTCTLDFDAPPLSLVGIT